jgi:hypothetical protein
VGKKYAIAPLAIAPQKEQPRNGTVTQKLLQTFYEAAELVGLLVQGDIFTHIRA